MKSHPLKIARESRQWSQNKIAEEVGVSIRTVRRWEQGLVMPTPYYRRQLCALLGQTAKELGLSSNAYGYEVLEDVSIPMAQLPEQASPVEDKADELPAIEAEQASPVEEEADELPAIEAEQSSPAEEETGELPAIEAEQASPAEDETGELSTAEQESSSHWHDRYETSSLAKNSDTYHPPFIRIQRDKRRSLKLMVLLSAIVILIGLAFWPSGILKLNILKTPVVMNTSLTNSTTNSSTETEVAPQVHNNCQGPGWQSHTSSSYGQYYTVNTNGSSFCYQAIWSMPNNITAAKSCDFHIIAYPGSNASVRYYFFTNHRNTVYANITQTSSDWSYFPKFLDVNFIELEIDDNQSGTIISVGPFFIQNCHPIEAA